MQPGTVSVPVHEKAACPEKGVEFGAIPRLSSCRKQMDAMKISGSILIFAGLPLLILTRAVAQPPEYRRDSSPQVSVEFLVAGRPLPIHGSRDGDGFVVVPRWGVEYEIRIANHERHDRVLFVIGVDGLSVMDGSRASQRSGGYVLEPGESSRIRGWRRGLDHVAAFTSHRARGQLRRTDGTPRSNRRSPGVGDP